MSTSTDKEILAAWQEYVAALGDEPALADAADRMARAFMPFGVRAALKYLNGHSRSIFSDDSELQDTANAAAYDAFADMKTRATDPAPIENIPGFYYRTVVNRCIDRVRPLRRRPRPVGLPPGTERGLPDDHEALLEIRAAWHAVLAALNEYASRGSLQRKDVRVLLTYREAAAVSGLLSLGAVEAGQESGPRSDEPSVGFETWEEAAVAEGVVVWTIYRRRNCALVFLRERFLHSEHYPLVREICERLWGQVLADAQCDRKPIPTAVRALPPPKLGKASNGKAAM